MCTLSLEIFLKTIHLNILHAYYRKNIMTKKCKNTYFKKKNIIHQKKKIMIIMEKNCYVVSIMLFKAKK